MKHLKYFESVGEKIDTDHYNGLTKELLEDMFVDISDAGFDVRVSLLQRTVVLNPSSQESGIKMRLGDIPYIEVKIYTFWQPNMDYITQLDDANKKIIELYKNPELFEIIRESNQRINDYNWYVSEVMLDPPGDKYRKVIKIFLHRQKDKKYVVPYISEWKLKQK